MNHHEIEIQIQPGRRPRAQILIDGHDVAGLVRRFQIDSDAGGPFAPVAQVDLELITGQLAITTAGAVQIDDETRRVLLILGWTPPAGDP